MKVKYTVAQFNEQFPDDAACMRYLFDQQFPDGGTCEKCGKSGCFHPITNRRQFACAWCGFQIAPAAGTIFHKSSTSLKTWFFAMFLMTASRNGVSAMELMRQTGVTYKTAWRMNHQIRELMNKPSGRFYGVVEADETYIGGVRKGKTGRGAGGKTPVVGILKRGGSIKVKAMPDVSANTITLNIGKNVRRGTTVMTDDFSSYKWLSGMGFDHKTINHSEGYYVKGDVHTQGIESFWAQLKRSINGTFHHVSPKHLQRYLNEFAYRHNHRHSANPMFCELVATAGEQRN